MRQKTKIFLITATTLAAPAFGQNLPSSPTSQSTAGDGSAQASDVDSGEITVTARKREEALSDVPLAVSALTGESLSERQVTDLRSLSQSVPSLYFESQGASRNDRSINTVVVRGMPAGTTQNATGERASVFIDGAPVFGGFVQGLTDVASVEILRGPQSAYFGRATFSGAINLRTRAPANEFRGRVEASYGSYDHTDNQVVLEGPIVPGLLGARISGRYYSTDGQYENTANPGEELGSRETKAVSGTLYLTPADNLTVKFFGTYWRDDDGPDARGLLRRVDFNCNANNGAALNYICGPLPDLPAARIGQNTQFDQTFFNEVMRNASNRFVVAVPGNFKDDYGLGRRAHHVNLVADWDLGPVSLSYVGSLDKNGYIVVTDSDATDSRDAPNARFPATPFVKPYIDFALRADVELRGTYNEVRLTSADEGPFTWLMGGSIFDGERAGSVFGLANTGFSQFTPRTVAEVDTKGVFGGASYDFGDRFNLSLEGRYQVDRVAQIVGTAAPRRAEFESFTPRVIASFKPTEDTTLFASYARGVNPGGLNAALFALPAGIQDTIRAQSGAELEVGEEKIDNYEIGFKGITADRRLSFSLGAYIADWTDQQLSNQVFFTNPATGATNGVTVTTNIGRTRLWGLEAEASYRLSPQLTLSGALSLNENELKEYICLVCRTQITGGTGDVAGNKLGRTPRFTGNFSAEWEDALVGDWSYFLRADYSHRGRIYVEESNLNWISPQNIANLRLGVSNDVFRFEGFVTNLFQDDTYVSAQQSTDLARGGLAVPVGLAERRRFGVRGTFRF